MCTAWRTSIVAGFLLASVMAAPAVPAEDGEDLFLVATASRDTTQKSLVSNLTKGVTKTPSVSCDVENIGVKEITRDAFNRLSQLVSTGAGSTPLQSDVTIEHDDQQENRWLLYLGSPFLDLEKITVKFHKAGGQPKSSTVTYSGDQIGSVASGADAGKLKVLTRKPGLYFVTLDDQAIPDAYEVEVVDARSGKKSNFGGAWPRSDKHFLIHLPHFKGPKQALIDTCRDPKQLADPIRIDTSGKSITIGLAEVGDVESRVGDLWNKHVYTVSFSEPENRFPKRVLMAFPLSQVQVDGITKKFPARGMQTDGKEISKILRKDAKVTMSPAPENTVPVYDLAPSNGVQWYEIPRQVVDRRPVFQASFEVKDLPEWKKVKEPGRFRVYAFEFDDGTPEIVTVSHPLDNTHARVLDEEDQSWLLGLNKLIVATEKKPVENTPAEAAAEE